MMSEEQSKLDLFFLNDVIELDPEKIINTEYQPRSESDNVRLQQLADSIKETGGNLESVIVIQKDGKYFTISGHQRVAASKIAGTKVLARIVRDVSDEDAMTIAAAANTHTQMSPKDYISAVRREISAGRTREEIAKLYGKGLRTIDRYGRIAAKLAESLLFKIGSVLTVAHAEALCDLNHNMQIKMYIKIRDEKWTAEHLREEVKRLACSIPDCQELAVTDIEGIRYCKPHGDRAQDLREQWVESFDLGGESEEGEPNPEPVPCSRCGRMLTTEKSRKLKIGPICVEKAVAEGDPSQEIRDAYEYYISQGDISPTCSSTNACHGYKLKCRLDTNHKGGHEYGICTECLKSPLSLGEQESTEAPLETKNQRKATIIKDGVLLYLFDTSQIDWMDEVECQYCGKSRQIGSFYTCNVCGLASCTHRHKALVAHEKTHTEREREYAQLKDELQTAVTRLQYISAIPTNVMDLTIRDLLMKELTPKMLGYADVNLRREIE